MALLVVTIRVSNSLFGGNTVQIVCSMFINIKTYLKGDLKNLREREKGLLLLFCVIHYCFGELHDHCHHILSREVSWNTELLEF